MHMLSGSSSFNVRPQELSHEYERCSHLTHSDSPRYITTVSVQWVVFPPDQNISWDEPIHIHPSNTALACLLALVVEVHVHHIEHNFIAITTIHAVIIWQYNHHLYVYLSICCMTAIADMLITCVKWHITVITHRVDWLSVSCRTTCSYSTLLNRRGQVESCVLQVMRIWKTDTSRIPTNTQSVNTRRHFEKKHYISLQMLIHASYECQ